MARIIISIIFFISGCCGLGYEIIWSRELQLVLGHTTYSITAVLTAFMSGLAAGSYFIGKFIDHSKSPITLYAYLEFGIGIYGIIFFHLLKLHDFFYLYIAHLLTNSAVDFFVKFALAFALMILPTTLMGATFPAMSKILMKNLKSKGMEIGVIYFLNSAGGAFGCLITGFFLIEYFGNEFASNIISIFNILCGISALIARKYITLQPSDDQLSADTDNAISAPESANYKTTADNKYLQDISNPMLNIALPYLLAVTGFAAMAYEIAWTRFLILIIGSATQSFSIMLFTSILFLCIGALIGGMLSEKNDAPVITISHILFLSCLFMLLTIPFYDKMPDFFASMSIMFKNAGYNFYQIIKILTCVLIMAVPTAASGSILPLTVKSVKISLSDNAGIIGKLYSFNTAGCILGSLATGLFILPTAGIKLTLIIVTALIITASYIIICLHHKKPSVKYSIVFISLIAVSLTVSFNYEWDYKSLNHGSYYRLSINMDPNEKILYYKEGISATVYTCRSGNKITLKINGKTDGSTSPGDMLTQQLLGILPFMNNPEAKSVLIVGLGTGNTLAAACRFKNLKNITCLEISPEVVEAAKFFEDAYKIYSADARVSIKMVDARNFMASCREKYDVIISEPSNPWICGVSSMFTVEFFELCRKCLTPEGKLLAWFHSYETNDLLHKLIIRTFMSVFDNCCIYSSFGDQFLLGEMTGIKMNSETSLANFDEVKTAQPQIAEHILNKNFNSNPLIFDTFFVMNSEQLKLYAGDGPLNSDNFQTLEFGAPECLFYFSSAAEFNKLEMENIFYKINQKVSKTTDKIQLLKYLKEALSFFRTYKKNAACELIYNHIINLEPDNDQYYYELAVLKFIANEYKDALSSVNRAITLKPQNILYKKFRAEILYYIFETGTMPEDKALLKTAVEDAVNYSIYHEKAENYMLISYLYFRLEEYDNFFKYFGHYQRLSSGKAKTEDICFTLAQILILKNKYAEALKLYQAAYQQNGRLHEPAAEKIEYLKKFLSSTEKR